MNTLLVFVAFICALFGELIALGAKLFGSTTTEWLFAALMAYFLSLLWPWVDARRNAP